ncbi:hypothetical protein HO520_09300 [Streptococcus suis]|nr:hypothetical protein [Streptococcus suis]
MVFSQWEDKCNKGDLNQLLETILSTSNSETDIFDNTELNEKREKVFVDNQFVVMSGYTVEYNYVEYSYEYVKKGKEKEPNREDRVGEYSAKIIVFKKQEKLYFLIDKSYSNKTLTNLRKMMNYSGKGEIVEHRFSGLKSDIFIWTLYRLLKHKNKPIDNQGLMKLETLVGFMGETEDKLAAISGAGRRVIDLLTTLLFLFENRNISKVELTIDYAGEKFKIIMGERSFIDVDIRGSLINNIVAMDEKINCEILLKTFNDVIPLYIISFSNHIDNKTWTPTINKRFFKDIGKDITAEIRKLSKEI